jgi:Aminomethyltransferase folate-binding domain
MAGSVYTTTYRSITGDGSLASKAMFQFCASVPVALDAPPRVCCARRFPNVHEVFVPPVTPVLKRTSFYDFHVKSGARMVDFAGWEMPLLCRGIIEEHQHTRTAASIFDASHMGWGRKGVRSQ